MYELQTTITINGNSYHICNNGDFRMVLDCFECLNDTSIDIEARVYSALLIFYDDFISIEELIEGFGENIVTAVEEMYKFFNCGDVFAGVEKPYKLIDWHDDSNIIVSAINNVAGKEIRAESFCHWWTFMAYYMEIGDCTLSQVVSIRDKIVKGKKLEKYEQEFRTDNPQYFDWKRHSESDQNDIDRIMSMWENGGN